MKTLESALNRSYPANWLALVSAVLLTAAGANGADLVWMGGTGDWNAGGNWSTGLVPSAADNAFITNAGTYTVTVSAGTTATAGTLTVGGASGTQTLAIDRATFTLNGNGLVNANGHLDLLVSQSVLTGAGNLTVNGTLNWVNGTLSGTGTATIGSGGVMAIGSAGVTLSRNLSNGGVVTWSGGNLAISAGFALNNLATGVFDITADGHLTGQASTPINNAGLFRQTAGTVGTIISAPFNNSGILAVSAATLSLNLGGTHTGTFTNVLGTTLTLGGGSHVLGASSFVTGVGTLNVSGGATTLTANGTFGAGSTLTVSAGNVSLAAGCLVSAATVNVAGGVLNYNSPSSVASLNVSSGTLGGTSPVTLTGPLTLSGGTVTNALVTANGGIAITGGVTLSGGKLVNSGTAIWSAGNFTGANGAVFSNLFGANFINTFDGNAPSGAGTTPIFINAGVFAKTNGTAALGTTSIDFQFVNTGTVEVQTNTLRYSGNQQTAGLTLLDGGGLSVQAQPLQLLGGTLAGSGPITLANAQNVVNSAVITPGSPLGELDISGNYQQTASGALNIELGGYTAGSNFDRVTVTAGGAGGVATLSGTLNVSLIDGFSPTNGATFIFLTALSRVGAFSTFNYPSNDIGMQVSYEPASATLKVTNLKPFVANPIVAPAAGTYGSPFNFQFPANTFVDPDNDPLTYSASGMPSGIAFSGESRTFSGAPSQAGVFTVTVVANDGGTPALTVTNTFSLTVNPAPLTVAAQPQSRLYGAADPALTFTVSGLQFSDTAASVLSGSLARAPGETVAGGAYAITQGSLVVNSNYTIGFTGNTLAITPATLSIGAQPQVKLYGATDPALTFSVGGLQFTDTAASVLTGGLARVAGESVAGGPYAIAKGTLAANNNYAISFTGSALTINQRTLTVTASPRTKTYGETMSLNGALDFSSVGLQNNETIGAVTLTAGGTPAGTATNAPVGPYTITPSAATGGTFTAGNYNIGYASGPLTVNKASLSVTADDKTKTYGAADPNFTATYSGFVNNETSTALGGLLAFTRAPGENVSGYLITPSGLTSGNYNITFNPGTLTIGKAALTITAAAKTKTYGALDPLLTFGVSGLQFNDTAVGVLSGALARAAGETVAGSPYAITQGTLAANNNYSINFTSNVLTITRAALAITADARSKIYGASDPAFTVTYLGLTNNETAAVLGGTLAFTRAPGENVGGYLITPSGLTSGNYNITFNPGTLTIGKAALAITAAPKTKAYGAIDPILTFGVAGLQFSDTSGAVLSGALARASGETVAGSPYTITQGTLAPNGNYTVNFTGNTLAITRAPLSITAESKAKALGATDPAFTVAYTGFVNSETPSVLGGALTFTRAPGEGVGSYSITPSGLTGANYAITFNSGTLTIFGLPVISPPAFVGNTVVLTWTAFSNATYRVQFKSVLSAAGWTDVAGDVLATSSTASKSDILTRSNRFYRVQVVP